MSSSLIESYSLSSVAKKKGFSNCFIYRGLSMTPTFRNGDFLYTRSVVKAHISLGDVVVFSSPNKKDYTVHRIVAFFDTNFITRGDHNLRRDVRPILMEDIVGKVEIVENKNGIHRLANGKLGLWVARICHSVFWLDHITRPLLWIPYNYIRERRLMVIFWRPKITKIQIWVGNTQQIFKYLYKNRTIAIWDPYHQHFECRKPFDLIISSPLDKPKASS